MRLMRTGNDASKHQPTQKKISSGRVECRTSSNSVRTDPAIRSLALHMFFPRSVFHLKRQKSNEQQSISQKREQRVKWAKWVNNHYQQRCIIFFLTPTSRQNAQAFLSNPAKILRRRQMSLKGTKKCLRLATPLIKIFRTIFRKTRHWLTTAVGSIMRDTKETPIKQELQDTTLQGFYGEIFIN